MLTANLLGILGGIVFAAAFLPYLWRTVTDEDVSPNRAGWFIWAVIGILIFVTYIAGTERREAMWMPLAGALGPTIVFLFSLKYGEGGWTRFDRNCLLAAGGILLVWWITESALLAHFGALLTDLTGLLPTLKKAWVKPESEDLLSWTVWHAGTWFNLGAVLLPVFQGSSGPTVADLTYPLYFWSGSGLLLLGLMVRGRELREQVDTSLDN